MINIALHVLRQCSNFLDCYQWFFFLVESQAGNLGHANDQSKPLSQSLIGFSLTRSSLVYFNACLTIWKRTSTHSTVAV